MINNLNDGMAWGLFPILLSGKGFNLEQIRIVTALYPAVWGIGQLFTGKMADIFSKKDMLFIEMVLQTIVLVILVWAETMTHFVVLSSLLVWEQLWFILLSSQLLPIIHIRKTGQKVLASSDFGEIWAMR